MISIKKAIPSTHSNEKLSSPEVEIFPEDAK
jgi:hypothetical protein